tara:strand:- start:308 stop:514 length:207 start_codon:yes stop_codon:yes gene_type:complete
MIFGKLKENETIVDFEIEIQCVNCNKKVPGGMKSGETYFHTQEFNKDLEEFKKTYLCGICRDKKRTRN